MTPTAGLHAITNRHYQQIVAGALPKGAWKTGEVQCSCGIKTRERDGICVPCKNPQIYDWRVRSERGMVL